MYSVTLAGGHAGSHSVQSPQLISMAVKISEVTAGFLGKLASLYLKACKIKKEKIQHMPFSNYKTQNFPTPSFLFINDGMQFTTL